MNRAEILRKHGCLVTYCMEILIKLNCAISPVQVCGRLSAEVQRSREYHRRIQQLQNELIVVSSPNQNWVFCIVRCITE